MTKHVDADALFNKPEIGISILSFLKAINDELPEALCSLLGLDYEEIPDLGRHQWQLLLEALLFSETFFLTKLDQEYVNDLKRQLKSSELLRKRELSLERSRRIDRSLSLSSSKIKTCTAIRTLESTHLGKNLHQIVLTDYIRDEAIDTGLDIGEANLGAWPIFQALSAASPTLENLGLLIGRLSLIHHSKREAFFLLVNQNKVTCAPAPQRLFSGFWAIESIDYSFYSTVVER